MKLRVILLSFFVDGTPIPQGSKRAWYNAAAKRVMMTEDQGVRHSTWRHQVTGYARQAVSDAGLLQPLTDALLVSLTFNVHHPLGHYGTGRNAAVLKASAPPYPARMPDIDKLTRSVLDSLTSVVFVDDGQVVTLIARKRYVDRYSAPEGVLIAVSREEVDGE